MLKTARKRKGLTMKELGTMVGVSESAISQYENGRREADFETLLKISEALNCTVDYLLRGEDTDVIKIESLQLFADESVQEPTDEAYQQIKKFILKANQDERDDVWKYIEFINSKKK